jgi:hypothetical protein
MPVTKSSLMKVCSGEEGELKGIDYYKIAISGAQKKLRDVFGYDVVSIGEKESDDKNREVGPFILVNLLDERVIADILTVDKTANATRGFLILVLSLIFCQKGHRIKSSDLWKSLAELGLARKKNSSEYVTIELEASLALFEKQRYILKDKESDLDEDNQPVLSYSMGPRAMQEVGKRNILHCVSQIMNKTFSEEEIGRFMGTVEEEEEEGMEI